MPRQLKTTKTSHEEWTQIFSISIVIIPTHLLCQMQANPSGAEFLSTISKFIKRKEILSLLVYVLHKTWNYAVPRGSRAVTAKKYTKAWCTCKVVVLPCQAITFFTFSSPLHLKLPIIYDTLWSVRNIIFSVQIELLLLIASETFFGSSVVPSFLVRKAWWTNRATVAW